jgi:hypothetical protein
VQQNRGLPIAASRGTLRPIMPLALALALLLLGAVCRLLFAGSAVLGNFSPLMAVAFCAAVYFRRGALWLAPFLALVGTDLWLNGFYFERGYGFAVVESLPRLLCFAAALGLGALVARHRSWLTLLTGALGGSVLFYLVTNTATWAGDEFYAKTFAGWFQALTTGHPGYPSTLSFFRNTFVSDLLFTGVFALTMETVAQRRGEPSLLAPRVTA